MAHYWASKNSIPFIAESERDTPEYRSLLALEEEMRGLTIAQGHIDIFGAFDMICALHYHYLNFMRAIKRKACRDLPWDAPEDRFEVVAYVNRIGQLGYFSESQFVKRLFSDRSETIPGWIEYLVPFRHKYSAHRDRDKPKKGTDEHASLNGELALGALGGWTFAEKYPGAFSALYEKGDSGVWDARKFEVGFVVYQLHGAQGGARDLILEQYHPEVFTELTIFMRLLIERAKARPRE